MHRVAIDDRDDPRLAPFLDLRDTQMRAAREPAEGFFLAEGVRTIRRALAAGYEPRGVLGTERMLGELDDFDGTAYVVTDAVLEATTGFPVHRGALASFSRRPVPDAASVLEGRIAWWSSRTSSTRRTSARSSASPRGSGGTPSCCRRGAAIRCTGGPSARRWARCSRCRGHV